MGSGASSCRSRRVQPVRRDGARVRVKSETSDGAATKEIELLKAEVAALRATVAAQSEIRAEVDALKATVADNTRTLTTFAQAVEPTFSVAQYNILASYLGDNRQPWFLYGIDCPQPRREAILKKFYERGADGKFINAGWPKYVDGILSDEERNAVEAVHARDFDWSVRKAKVLDVILMTNADLLSLVELDQFDFFGPALKARGYEAVYKKRPRDSSEDGCGIFFRTSCFKLLDSQSMEFIDRVDPVSGRKFKDRVGLLVLLQHLNGNRLILISTHLARNPEDNKQTKSRAKQAAQLLQMLTDFAATHDAMNVPVILAGDLNTTNIRQIANIARAVFELCERPCHPFVFTASAPRTLPTSVTTTRKMCIDYLLVQSSLEVVDQRHLPKISSDAPIPNVQHPSDHVPITFKLAFKSRISTERQAATSWVHTVLDHPNASVAPLRPSEMRTAFDFFDMEQSGGCERREFETALTDAGLLLVLDDLIAVIEQTIGRPLTNDGKSSLSLSEFAQVYTTQACRSKGRFKADMADAFAYFDTSGDGKLDREELYTTFVAACPFHVPRETFDEIFDKLDTNQDGHITVDEFVEFLIRNATLPA